MPARWEMSHYHVTMCKQMFVPKTIQVHSDASYKAEKTPVVGDETGHYFTLEPAYRKVKASALWSMLCRQSSTTVTCDER